jgi:Predicted solute binding protein
MPATSADTAAVAGIHARLAPGACSPPSTSPTAATPPWSTWSGPGASTRSPSPGRCPATAPASTASRRATPATTSASTTTARKSPARKARSARVARPLPDLLARRRPAHRGALHQGPVPALPRQGRLHHLRRRQAHRGLPPARTARAADPQPRRPARPRLAQALRVRSGIEGTVCEFARGHGMRHCRYRGQPKAHLQHVLTAIAVNIERLSQLPPGQSTSPRPPTAFQDYLDQHDIKRLRSWRAVS